MTFCTDHGMMETQSSTQKYLYYLEKALNEIGFLATIKAKSPETKQNTIKII